MAHPLTKVHNIVVMAPPVVKFGSPSIAAASASVAPQSPINQAHAYS